MLRPKREAGFTLLELMIVVLFIGILAVVAIPSYMSYHARSRRTEAFANLSGVARSEKTYFAERDSYFGTALPWPDPAVHNTEIGGVLGSVKMPWDAPSSAAFGALGWEPEGQVFYAYEVNTGCGCDACFTASAFGDVDSDGVISAVMYVQPDPSGAGITECPSIMAPGGAPFGTPTRMQTGQPVYREVAVNRSADEY
jgi:prepilin-type N-terminal cleavage/methylation domain-containing protein